MNENYDDGNVEMNPFPDRMLIDDKMCDVTSLFL